MTFVTSNLHAQDSAQEQEQDKVTEPSWETRPQTPQPPFPYLQEYVTYENIKDGVTFAGTLTIPSGDGPFAAVFLINGSGNHDRDVTIFEHKLFLVIADFLTRNGIAVLRSDDRGVGETSVGPPGATSADYATDAQTAVEFLREHPSIRKEAVGLIGHSEGGLIAPMVASRTDSVAFIVLLAGPGLRGDEGLLLQTRMMGPTFGFDEEAIARTIRTLKPLLAMAGDPSVTEEELRTRGREIFIQNEMFPDDEKREAAIKAQLDGLSKKWNRFYFSYDPTKTLEIVKCPVLALNGECDLAVPPKQNLGGIRKALEKSGNPDFQIKELPALNHLFQKCETGAIAEYTKIQETFSPEVLELILDWIRDRTTD